MKITNYTLLFLILCMPVYFIILFNCGRLSQTEQERIIYNNAIDEASQDALDSLVEYDSSRTLFINKERSVNNFFDSLYSNFGILDDKTAQAQLDLYIPVILVADEDGFYIYYSYSVDTANGKDMKKGWSEKLPYVYSYNNYVISFSMSDMVSVLDTNTGLKYLNNYHDLVGRFPDIPFFGSESSFQTIRRSAISNEINKSMEYYINIHNKLAQEYGITYQFYLPSITDEDWSRAIDNPAMFVLFQGYPYKSAKGYFNRMEVGAARIDKDTSYYISNVNGKKCYHSSDCPYANTSSTPYFSADECAKLGAYPCEYCEP